MKQSQVSKSGASAFEGALRDLTARHEQLVIELSLLKRLDELDPLGHDAHALCQEIAKAIASVLHAGNCSLMLFNEQDACLEIFGAASSYEEKASGNPHGARFRRGEGLAGHVAQTRTAVMADDVLDHPEFLPLPDSAAPIRSLLCYPILAAQTTLGVVNVSAATPRHFTDVTKHVMELAVEKIARLLMMQQLHQRLSESELRFRMIEENAGDAILLFGLDGKLLYANPATEQITGLPNERLLIGENAWSSGILPGDQERWSLLLNLSNTGERIGPVDFQYKSASGEIHFLEQVTTPLRTAAGKIFGTVAILRDVTGRMNAEKALRQTQERLDLALEAANLGLWDWHIPSGSIEHNQKIAEMLGFPPERTHTKMEEYLGFIHPQDRSAAIEKAQAHQMGEIPVYQAEFRMRTPGGEWKWVWTLGRVVEWDEHCRPVRMMGAQLDITARKQMEEALQSSEARFRAWAESTNAAMVIYQDLHTVYVNHAAEIITGYTQHELLTMSFLDFMHPEDRALVRERSLARMRGQEAPQRYEVRIIHRTGRRLWLDFTTVTITYEGRRASLGTAFDITERKTMEETLRISEERYRLLVENSPEAIARVDTQWRYIFVNQAFQNAVGLRESDVIGKTTDIVKARIHPEDIALFWENCEAVMNTGGTRLCNARYRNASGAWRWISQLAYPWFQSDGAIGGIEAMARDITEQKEAEQIIAEQRLKMAAASRLASLGILASGVAHEINNPLAIISLGAEQLEVLSKDPAADPALIQSTIGKIRRNVSRIERIVRGLRTLSHDGSKDPFALKSVNELVLEVTELCQSRFKTQMAALHQDSIDATLKIECRPVLIAQVLMNLFSNALDAVENLPERWVRVDCREDGGTVLLSITDSGPGIREGVSEHIFEPFFTSKEVGKGTGLGLSIAKAIVESHHGELYLDTTSANTRFVLALPKKQPPRETTGEHHEHD